MKRILFSLVLCFVSVVGFGQERINRSVYTYKTIGNLVDSLICWDYSESSGQWNQHISSFDGTNPEKMSHNRDNIISLQFKTIEYNDTIYYILQRKYYEGDYLYPSIQYYWIYNNLTENIIIDKQNFEKIKNINNNPVEFKLRAYTTEENDDISIYNIRKIINDKDIFIHDIKTHSYSHNSYIKIYKSTDGSIRFLIDSWNDIKDHYFEISEKDFEELINVI